MTYELRNSYITLVLFKTIHIVTDTSLDLVLWLKPVILATWEAKIERITVQASPDIK
jgi:hypothetical protein